MARPLTYMPALDGLRAVAIVFVLIMHGAKPFTVPGGFGVDVFFVLSGFLITTLLWAEVQGTSRIRLGIFYGKRAIRLVPSLFATIIITIPIALLLGMDASRLAVDSTAAAFYLTPFSTALVGDPLYYGHLWTLAVEEYFYLLWPIVFLLMVKLGLTWKTIAALAIGGGSLLYIAQIVVPTGTGYLRAGGIAVGCGIALIIAETRARGDARWLGAAAVVSLAAAAVTSTIPAVADAAYPLAAASAVATVFAVNGPRRALLQRVLESRPMVFIGKISYEVYLVHMLFLAGLAILFGTSRIVVAIPAYVLTFALAAALHFGFLPMQARLRRALTRPRALAGRSVPEAG
ncbi:peptidoglycan/LPS O-acetylase OafA/YrhL [Microbacterium resistens]|uniref:Peptidoglycan/LPS O-acetylase OafA/YrhL n=1 Tax=Microbacterium resistens TaxID=156977 RepID=A0ABU1SAG2_9MICO|nr:acyltransferase [Microbacterium resistens]MDR6866590.1 peptidoglycan/LPS O-acetylase OafA/YrhL [Microbacterium resistens]